MKKIYLLASLLLLASCNSKSNTIIASNSSSSLSNNSSVSYTSNVDYTLFDQNVVGIWYTHSSFMGELPINTTIQIFENYTLIVQKIRFNFVGMYENFEGTCKFISESGMTSFIVSYDYDSHDLDWAYEDTAGNSDMGVARSTALSNDFQYDYIGSIWPMTLINEYLETSGNIPAFNSLTYYLLCSTSQVNEGAKYGMIDIFDAPLGSAESYVSLLRNSGFTFGNLDGMGFYQGYDSNHTYALKIKYFDSDSNLTIFVYRYEAIYK